MSSPYADLIASLTPEQLALLDLVEKDIRADEREGLVEHREALAAIEHEQWMAWSRNLSVMEDLSEDRLDRWEALWVPYDQLTEAQKDMDREWADKVLTLLALDAPEAQE